MTAQIRHPLIEKWAEAWFQLDNSVRKAVEGMSPEELQELKLAVASLTSTNCWFAEYDIRPVVEGHIATRAVRERAKKASMAPSSSLAAEEPSK